MNAGKDEILAKAKTDEKIAAALEGKTIVKETQNAIKKQREAMLADYKGNIVFLQNAIYDVSSTFLREKITAGEDVSAWLTDSVKEYIEKENLYHV